MSGKTEEIYEQEMVSLGRDFMAFLFGIGFILGMWFLSGLLYVILKS